MAERLVFGNVDPAAEIGDQLSAIRLADNVGDFGSLLREVTDLLSRQRAALKRVADALLEVEMLSGADLARLSTAGTGGSDGQA